MFFRKDRKSVRGGGLLVYVKNDINCKEIKLNCMDMECMAARMILSSNISFIVICIYRPPSSNITFYERLWFFHVHINLKWTEPRHGGERECCPRLSTAIDSRWSQLRLSSRACVCVGSLASVPWPEHTSAKCAQNTELKWT